MISELTSTLTTCPAETAPINVPNCPFSPGAFAVVRLVSVQLLWLPRYTRNVPLPRSPFSRSCSVALPTLPDSPLTLNFRYATRFPASTFRYASLNRVVPCR